MSNKNNIENQDDDLKGMAPHLFKLNNNGPFKANDDYFENFSSKIQNRINDLEEIKIEAPLLSDIPKYNPFEIPVNYFEDLPGIVQQQAINNKPSTSVIEWLLLFIKPRFAVPVLATIFIAIAGINFMNKNAELPKNEMAEEISVEEQLYNIDEATIIETLPANANTENTDISTEDTTIKNYLIDNHVDESNLNNEL
jgi:hypothetical protein